MSKRRTSEIAGPQKQKVTKTKRSSNNRKRKQEVQKSQEQGQKTINPQPSIVGLSRSLYHGTTLFELLCFIFGFCLAPLDPRLRSHHYQNHSCHASTAFMLVAAKGTDPKREIKSLRHLFLPCSRILKAVMSYLPISFILPVRSWKDKYNIIPLTKCDPISLFSNCSSKVDPNK